MAATKIQGTYTEENLKAAVKAVNEDGLSYGDALKIFNMPTIHNTPSYKWENMSYVSESGTLW